MTSCMHSPITMSGSSSDSSPGFHHPSPFSNDSIKKPYIHPNLTEIEADTDSSTATMWYQGPNPSSAESSTSVSTRSSESSSYRSNSHPYLSSHPPQQPHHSPTQTHFRNNGSHANVFDQFTPRPLQPPNPQAGGSHQYPVSDNYFYTVAENQPYTWPDDSNQHYPEANSYSPPTRPTRDTSRLVYASFLPSLLSHNAPVTLLCHAKWYPYQETRSRPVY